MLLDQDWHDLLPLPTGHWAALLQIEGIPYTFCTHTLENIELENVVTIEIGKENYGNRRMLAPEIAAPTPALSMGSGIVQPVNTSFRLVDDQTDFLLSYFRMIGANKTRLTISSSAAQNVMDVVSTAGFTVPGTIYLGRETMTAGAAAAAQFQNVTRGLWGSLATNSVVTPNYSIEATQISDSAISDYPRVWKGRWVRLWIIALSDITDDGVGILYDPLCTTATYEIDATQWAWNAWTGTIDDLSPDDNFVSLTLDCRDIVGTLYSNVKANSAKGTLWVPQEAMIYIPVNANRMQIEFSQKRDTPTGAPVNIGVCTIVFPQVAWISYAEFKYQLQSQIDTWCLANFPITGAAIDYASTLVEYDATDGARKLTITINTIDGLNYDYTGYIRESVDLLPLPFRVPNGGFSEAGPNGASQYFFWEIQSIKDYYVAPTADVIYITTDDITAWPMWGTLDTDDAYVVMQSESGYAELFMYRGTPTTTAYTGVYALNIPPGGRGRAGTVARTLIWMGTDLPTGEWYQLSQFLPGFLSSGDPIWNLSKVQLATVVYQPVNFWTAAIGLAVGTKGNLNNGALDGTFADAGLAIQERHFDTGAFTRLTVTDCDFALRFFLTNDIDFADFLGDHAMFGGRPIGSKQVGQYYQISPIDPTGIIAPDIQLDEDDCLWIESPRIIGMGAIVNTIRAKLNYDPVANKYTEPGISLVQLSSVADHGQGETLEIRAMGFGIDLATQMCFASLRAAEIFSRLSRPRYRLRVALGPIGWKISPGDCIAVTHSAVWNVDGTRGISATPFLVIQNERTYMGEGPSSILTLERRLDIQATYWSPSGLVSNIAAGRVDITIAANTYTTAGEGISDYQFFETGYAINFYNQRLNAFFPAVINNRVAGVITINAALPAPWVVGDVIIVFYDDWTNQSVDQRLRSISQSSPTGYVSGTTEGYQWA